jgi:hypothetical protein
MSFRKIEVWQAPYIAIWEAPPLVTDHLRGRRRIRPSLVRGEDLHTGSVGWGRAGDSGVRRGAVAVVSGEETQWQWQWRRWRPVVLPVAGCAPSRIGIGFVGGNSGCGEPHTLSRQPPPLLYSAVRWGPTNHVGLGTRIRARDQGPIG